MTTPDADAEDASLSPEYSGDQDGSDMAAEQKSEPKSGAASPSQQTQKPPSNAKDPLRPRRKKARRACLACQRAHLTCDDERPCGRCLKRNLQDTCMDGVRKKAKYLHDAPDGALLPGVGAHYAHMNGTHQGLPGQDPGVISMAPQGNYFTQPPTTTYYAQNPGPAQVSPVLHDGQHYSSQQTPISPPYNQTHHPALPSDPNAVSQGAPPQMQQFGGPLFDPSDPGLFNFDISSLNFGNHYGALELGMLGHMSSGAAETPPNETGLLNPLNQAADMYPHTGPYDNTNIPARTFGPDGLPIGEWQNPHTRNGSLQMQTPNNTPVTGNLDHGSSRNDSLNGPHAYAIGQGASSLSSASPASTEVNAGYDNDNPLSAAAVLFAHAHQPQAQQRSPTVGHLQPDPRLHNTSFQPVQTNLIRKRRRDTGWIYEGITRPYDYVGAFHRLKALIEKRYPPHAVRKIMQSLGSYRPTLLTVAGELDQNDLVHSEKNLQRSLLTLQEQFAEVGIPSLVCRRTGEVLAASKEFSILTGWHPEVLLGHEQNLNVNTGGTRDPSSETSTRTSITPNLTAQEPDYGTHPVNVIELMDETSALQYFEDFRELAYVDVRGWKSRRVNMLKYRTKEDVARLDETKSGAMPNGTGKNVKQEVFVKREGGPVYRSEAAMQRLGAKEGMVDCMIWWHIKRDNFDLPMLSYMVVLPVLPGTHA
ncbi:hypothetical protein BDV95DRAFT_608425 [Massariosphaeria phaeospora]|uniref:Zn(2)-C6 fungal-type domain-containing protein n=1 Tax=Massariosphaeria phaeospora TaxID=100035 RepID=A0A7C8IDH7_9PLEO|nr:hypothetical protein BDV95DRAFT_608425 [Massariosphaeria phaeospora]